MVGANGPDSGGPLPTPAPRRRRRRIWVGAAAAVVVAGILVGAAFEIPVSTPFDLSVRSEGFAAGVEYREFPPGAHVSFGWNTSNGRSVTFSLLGPNGQVLSATTAEDGHLDFVASAGPYGFQSASFLPETVEVEGNYASPVLP